LPVFAELCPDGVEVNIERREKAMTVSEISKGIWQFNESNEMFGGPYVDAYLIVGENRALLVDSLQTETGLYEELRKITKLPVDVVITHGHGDHAGASLPALHDNGCTIYMDRRDTSILKDPFGSPVNGDRLTNITNGTVFDLGGFKLEVISVTGHTPGSLVLLEREKQLLFSGDTIGSGNFWMQLPASIALNLFSMNLERLWGQVTGMENLLVYPGHRNQSPVQLNLQYVKDTLTKSHAIDTDRIYITGLSMGGSWSVCPAKKWRSYGFWAGIAAKNGALAAHLRTTALSPKSWLPIWQSFANLLLTIMLISVREQTFWVRARRYLKPLTARPRYFLKSRIGSSKAFAGTLEMTPQIGIMPI